MSEEKYTPEEYFATYDGVVVEADGDMKMAHFEDFTNLQESPCAFGVTDTDAIAALALQCKESNTAMLDFLVRECDACKYASPVDGCDSCYANDSCPRLRVIRKAKGKESVRKETQEKADLPCNQE